MFKLWKYRRGQVRGIDFSLAMVIFLLTMSQILVLTTTFIQSSRSFQGTNQLIEDTNTLALDILTNPGGTSSSTSWETIETSVLTSSNWQFGLANSNSEVNPFKLGRLANNSLPTFSLDYSTLETGLHDNSTFKIAISTPLNISLTTVVDTGSSVQVSGLVTSHGSPVGDAQIWIFIYTSQNEVIETFLRTGSSGIFNQNLVPTTYGASTFFVVTAIAKVGIGSEALDFRILPKVGNSAPTVNTQTIQPNYSSTTGHEIVVRSNQIQTDPNQVQHIAFYSSSGTTNFTQITNQGTTNGTSWQEDIAIPPQGLVGILTHELDGGTHYFAYTTFPLLMDNIHHSDVGPVNEPGTETITINQLIWVRGVYLEFKLTIWRTV